MNNPNEGLVLSIKRGIYEVESANGITKCRAATGIRKKEGRILAGDRVVFSENGIDGGFITNICKRRNSLVRPPVANIDLLAIAVAVKDPEPFLYNTDLLSVIAEKNAIETVLLITKCDLGDPEAIENEYRNTGIKTVRTSFATGEGIESAREALKGKVSVLCGASGVGKSSLLNAMYPHLNAETGELSGRIARGRNTTRVTELFPLSGGTYLADTPGFTAIDTELYCEIDHKELYTLFPEFSDLAGKCRYSDCTHTKEKECAVARAAEEGFISRSRYSSYKKLFNELKSINRYK